MECVSANDWSILEAYSELIPQWSANGPETSAGASLVGALFGHRWSTVVGALSEHRCRSTVGALLEYLCSKDASRML